MSYYTDVIQKSPLFHSTDSIRDVGMLDPNFKARVDAIMADAVALGHHLMITETYRSQERQAMLFEQKKTMLKNVGVHHYSLAVDFAKVINGKASWDGDWSFLAPLAKKHKVIWGGDWGNPAKNFSFKDVDHIQMVAVQDQAKLFNGSWYPDANYNPYDHIK